MLALASIYVGSRRSEAAKMVGVRVQIIRDWVERFNREGPEGLLNRKANGASPKLNAEQREALVRMGESGPIPAVHGVDRWRLVDLAGWIHDEYGLVVSETTLGRILKALGYRKLSVHPKHHGRNEYVLEDLKKLSDEIARIQSKPPKDTGMELWYQWMKPASGRRTRSPVAGPNEAPAVGA